MEGTPESTFEGLKAEIEYPCRWVYKIIGRRETYLRRAVNEIVGSQSHTLTFSRHSSEGKYCSMRLELVVSGERQRLEIGAALHEHPDVRFVL
jgi:hypothetical protein